jgi:hypothetical protein
VSDEATVGEALTYGLDWAHSEGFPWEGDDPVAALARLVAARDTAIQERDGEVALRRLSAQEAVSARARLEGVEAALREIAAWDEFGELFCDCEVCQVRKFARAVLSATGCATDEGKAPADGGLTVNADASGAALSDVTPPPSEASNVCSARRMDPPSLARSIRLKAESGGAAAAVPDGTVDE